MVVVTIIIASCKHDSSCQLRQLYTPMDCFELQDESPVLTIATGVLSIKVDVFLPLLGAILNSYEMSPLAWMIQLSDEKKAEKLEK